MEPKGLTLQTMAILVAVLIFATRELLDLLRRQSANRNKLEAIKQTLLRACHQNHWTFTVLRQQLVEIKNNYPIATYKIYLSDHDFPKIVEKVDGETREFLLYETHEADFQSVLLAAAELDGSFAKKIDHVITGVWHIKIIRRRLIGLLTRDGLAEFPEIESDLAKFSDDGIKAIDAESKWLTALFKACTRQSLPFDPVEVNTSHVST